MGGSSSSSASTTKNETRDGRVAGDNGAIGLSVGEGNVDVHIVSDEAFQLGGDAIREIAEFALFSTRTNADLARFVANTGGRATETAQSALSVALDQTQQRNRSEETQLSEQIIKIGIPAAAIAFAVSQIWGSK